MSKKILSLIFASILSTSAWADMAPLSFGIKGGLGFGKISQANVSSDFKMNYLLGGGVDFGTTPVGVLVDVLYALRTYDIGSGSTNFMKRIEIPVQARIALGLVRIQGGLYWAKVLGNVTQKNSLGVETTYTLSQATLDSTDMGIVLGVGATLSQFSVEARYLFGTKNISQSAGNTIKTSSFELIGGFWF